MIKNYFIIALRNFKKDRINTCTGLLGLVAGLTCIMLITGYIHYELSFDKNFTKAGKIYRVLSEYTKNDYGVSENVPAAFGPTICREILEVERQTHINTYKQSVLVNGIYNEFTGSEVDSGFFSIFDFKFISGNPATALNSLDNIVLTASTAKKFYNSVDVSGKLFSTKAKTYTIAGVIRDIPDNVFLHTDCFIPVAANNKLLDVAGGWGARNSFILLGKYASPQLVQKKITQLCSRYKMDDYKISLQPLTDIHLYSTQIKGNLSYYNIGELNYLYIYGCIGILILIIACINFINLTIARSLERRKEVGVRKVLGAGKVQLVVQFIGESSLSFMIAFPLSLVLACGLWNQFTQLLNIDAGLSYLLNISSLLLISAICVFSCLLSSVYPAAFLSRLLPLSILRGGSKNVDLNFSLRKVLVVVQFAISIALIICTIVVHWQLNFITNRPLGFNKDNLVEFDIPFLENFPSAFKKGLLQSPNIHSASTSSVDIANSYSASASIRNPADTTKLYSCVYLDGDFDFLKTFEVPVIEGRDFSPDYSSDKQDYDSLNFLGADKKRPMIVSRSFITALAIKDPIGKEINAGVFMQGTIIGIIDEFNGTSSKEKDPLVVIRCRASGKYLNRVYVRINAENTRSSIAFLSKIHNQFFPQEKFNFSFVDDRIAHLYDSEIRLTKQFNIFAVLAILLSASGLFGLISLVVRNRSKEVGIRKILGASVVQIYFLLAKNFLMLVIVAFIIASPLAWLFMRKWVESYSYHTQIPAWVFLITGLLAVLIGMATISYQMIRAAFANPVKSLRNE